MKVWKFGYPLVVVVQIIRGEKNNKLSELRIL